MTNHKHLNRAAETKQDKALFASWMVWVVDQLCALISEYRFGFVKGDAMLLCIGGSFSFNLLKSKRARAEVSLQSCHRTFLNGLQCARCDALAERLFNNRHKNWAAFAWNISSEHFTSLDG
jgi:hypothetical protein